MSLNFGWRRWIPNERHDIEDELGNIIDWGLRKLSIYKPQGAAKEFSKLWKYWNKEFPGKWVLTTLTTQPFDGCNHQLRFWFGEPSSFGRSHANSNGHNLIAQVDGPVDELTAFAESLQGTDFQKGIQGDCWTWRRIKKGE